MLFVAAFLGGLYVYLKDNVDDWPTVLDDSIEIVIASASGLLGFILALNLSAALSRNESGNSNFNAFCGDVLAMAMFVCSLTVDKDVDEAQFKKVKNNFRDLLLAAPQVCKYTFRSTVDVDLIPVKLKGRDSNGNRMSEKLYQRNKAMYCLVKRYEDIGAMESIMLAISNNIQELTAMKAFGPNDAAHMAMIGKWENIYSSYGNLGNMFSYSFPLVLNWLLNICLIFYIILMPYGISGAKYHAIWLSFIVAYFYLGLYIVSSRIGNPFEEGMHNPNQQEEFAKVGAAAEAAQKAVEVLFKEEAEVGLDDVVCETPIANVLPQLPNGMKTLARERNLEFGEVKSYKY
nr:bestrophin family ion channel [Allomuricauda sp.]